jgi:DNA-binding GntR family transcriptional regulator
MGRAVHRRTRLATPVRHSAFSRGSAPPRPPSAAELLHTFELASVLEAHAVHRVATAARSPDLHAARLALADLDLAIDARGVARWAGLELQLHRALNDQSGNLVLAALAERTLRDGLTACPILSPDVLRVLQTHHRDILRSVEARHADAAVRHTRAHVLFLRDTLLRGTHPRERVRVHS